jgi:TetR/AcrR family transcriptional repressor of nem operon
MVASTTKEKIVELGRGFIQHSGYHSFNYKQISTQLNIKNAAIHHYYPAKEDLGLAVIQKDKQDFADMNKRVENAPPMEQVEALIYSYNEYFNDRNKMCIIGTFSSAYNEIPEKIQVGAKDYLDFVMRWLTRTFEAGHESGHFRFEGSAEQLADFWVATLTGSLQIGRIRGAEYFKQLFDNLKKTLRPK